jgi:alpha-glucosidase (family GH31 glycosyl hydrolase)
MRFYGLGPRNDGAVELRGSRVPRAWPFLMSSAGYGEYHVAPGSYTFDLARAKPDRYRIEARGAAAVDYYFFFGPAPKEILEQYLLVHDRTNSFVAGTIHSLINGSLSGVLVPPESLAAYLKLPGGLTAYFATYAQETRDRGLPFLRALLMQFPKDAQAAGVNDEFMLGDELLAAPMHQGQNSRRVYLPMGIWTRLGGASRQYPGKQTITIEGKPGELILFSRNGSILPLGSEPMTLHYFPRLGGEFFLFESDLEDYSQVHAAPAGDFMRLEIESKKDRLYEWVLHHVERPIRLAENGVELAPGAWSYDPAERSLHVRVLGRAGADEIVSISFGSGG